MNFLKNIFASNKKSHIEFDKVYCISYCRNIRKQNDIRTIMNYLGIDFEFIYGADMSNLTALKNKDFIFKGGTGEYAKYQDFKYYMHFIAASYDHYTAVLHAYESGANSVLIFEDDCVFHNDKKHIIHYLNNYPTDADIVKFGYYNWCNIKYDENNHFGNDEYVLTMQPTGSFAGCQFYGICNRETMKKYIDLQAKNFMSCDATFFEINDIKCYSLVPPLAVDSKMIKHTPEDVHKYRLLENIRK